MTELSFHRFSALAPNTFDFSARALVIAGWTGRDRDTLLHHVAELEALGVRRPSSMPVYYRVATGSLTQAAAIQVLGGDTSGEAEPVLMSMPDGLWLGVGSDHTDRKLETLSVALSKQVCAKVVGGDLWDCREIAGHWDELIVRSRIPGPDGGRAQLYQEGRLAQVLPPGQLIEGYAGPAGLPVGTVMFCGTFPAIGGIRPAPWFEMEIEDPILNRRLRHRYRIESLPLVE
ncbi:MAG: DUF2848 domain-containing protein [Burkholderiales bacterium]|nr:DUF2848 domain-containing protein [Burkholderiales bacterium]